MPTREEEEIARILSGKPGFDLHDVESAKAFVASAVVDDLVERNASTLKLTAARHGNPSAGNKYTQTGYPPPHIDSTPHPSSTTKWVASPLTGSRVLHVGKATYHIPTDSKVKRSQRAGVTWVNTNGRTFIYSADGCLNQTDAERAATKFDLL